MAVKEVGRWVDVCPLEVLVGGWFMVVGGVELGG